MKEGWQTALSLEWRVSRERKQANVVVGWVREGEECRERLRRWCGGVDINTFEGTKRIIREWAAWHAADGVGFGVYRED